MGEGPDLYTTQDPEKSAVATATTRAILTLGAAIAAGLVAWVSLAETRRANRSSDVREWETQVTDRYTKAIGQLGDTRLAIQLGGTYALERIAVDSDRDHRTIVEVLSVFVRNSSQPATSNRSPDNQSGARPEEQPVPAAAPAGDTGQTLTTDVQAALTVLGRLPSRDGVPRGDLTRARLAGAVLHGATLTRAALEEANLTHAVGGRANLTGAAPEGATLTGAQLSSATLASVHLDGADLAEAKGLTQQQVDSAHGDEDTKLPAGLRRPAHWSAGPATPPVANR